MVYRSVCYYINLLKKGIKSMHNNRSRRLLHGDKLLGGLHFVGWQSRNLVLKVMAAEDGSRDPRPHWQMTGLYS